MILCCGEALIDMIPAPVEGAGFGFVPHSGGAIFNTAIGLGRMNVPTGFLTGLSNDLFGTQLTKDLAASHVDPRFAIRSDLPTTLAFVDLNDGHATYTFYDENTAGRSLTPDQAPELPDDIAALYFGGISLAGEPCADFYAQIALQETGSRVIVMDPNIRPGFIQDEARYRARMDKMIGTTDILKVSDVDLDWMIPGDLSLPDKAKSLLAKGPCVVIVTRGSEGASAFTSAGDAVDVPAQKATVVDTVGAGDTFNAGVLTHLHDEGLLQKDKLRQITPTDLAGALRMGAAVASVTVSRAGANPPWRAELSMPDLA